MVGIISVKHYSGIHIGRRIPFDSPFSQRCLLRRPIGKAEAHAARHTLQFFLYLALHFGNDALILFAALDRVELQMLPVALAEILHSNGRVDVVAQHTELFVVGRVAGVQPRNFFAHSYAEAWTLSLYHLVEHLAEKTGFICSCLILAGISVGQGLHQSEGFASELYVFPTIPHRVIVLHHLAEDGSQFFYYFFHINLLSSIIVFFRMVAVFIRCAALEILENPVEGRLGVKAAFLCYGFERHIGGIQQPTGMFYAELIHITEECGLPVAVEPIADIRAVASYLPGDIGYLQCGHEICTLCQHQQLDSGAYFVSFRVDFCSRFITRHFCDRQLGDDGFVAIDEGLDEHPDYHCTYHVHVFKIETDHQTVDDPQCQNNKERA